MNAPEPTPSPPPSTVVWYESRVLRRIALSVLTQALAGSHVANWLTTDELAGIVNATLEILGILSAAWAAHARVTRPNPPVTLRKRI